MTGHLSPSLLNGLVDGELSADQLAVANEHLAGCPPCTSNALSQSLLKSAAAKAGQRYAPPPHLAERLTRLASSRSEAEDANTGHRYPQQWRFAWGWVAAAVLLLVSASTMMVQRHAHNAEISTAEQAALVTEVFDQHIATLAAGIPPQVVSTDRHTVKPWFQGKLPFSFNLPESLPRDTTLDGANLTYLRNQPVAQLLYSIGKHRVSVFVQEKAGGASADEAPAERAGFHVMDFSTNDLEGVAVSDVDPSRLAELVSAIRQVQTVR
jgi:anti-sigma factor RsiW